MKYELSQHIKSMQYERKTCKNSEMFIVICVSKMFNMIR